MRALLAVQGNARLRVQLVDPSPADSEDDEVHRLQYRLVSFSVFPVFYRNLFLEPRGHLMVFIAFPSKSLNHYGFRSRYEFFADEDAECSTASQPSNK